MKRMLLLPILLLASLLSYSQSLDTFKYYRIESKVDDKYSAIETEGLIYFTPTSFIIKSNNERDNKVFIIEEKVLESGGRAIYKAYPLEEETSVLFEVSTHYLLMFDPIYGDGLMFLKDSFKEYRDSLPKRDIWYEKAGEKYIER